MRLHRSSVLFNYTALLFPVLFILNSACAQDQNYPAEYVCYRSGNGLIIDGRIDDPDWENAPWTEAFVDIEGTHMPQPLFRTRAKMLWDDNYFYVAAELEEPHIWATYDKHDMVIFHEHDFEVFIDPDADTHMYYELEINAKGTVWDLMLGKPYRDGGPAINSWDIQGLKSAVHLYGDLNNPESKDEKWTIELAFPWEVLKESARPRKKPQNGDQWRVNFSRVEWKTDIVDGQYRKSINPDTGKPYPEFNWVWSPQGVIAMHQPETWAYVQFSDAKAGERRVSFQKNPEEEIKWALREVYYLQSAFKEENGRYATSISEIGAEKVKLGEEDFRPELVADDDTFHCSYPGVEAGSKWHIREDGKVWKTMD